MRYAEAIRWLYGLAPRGMRLDLERMRHALELRGRPERALRVVHVAGTNGKGSVSAMIERGLRAAGLRTGLYTSPHLHRFVERIRIDGRNVARRRAARGLTELRSMLEASGAPELTFFEVATLLAFELFAERGCDVVVLEVGLGGRLDATNVVTPELCVVTNIALEHTALLGPTVAHIAREKAGILKRRVPAVIGARDVSAQRVLRARASRLGAPMALIGRDFDWIADDDGALEVWTPTERHGPLRPSLVGDHQRDNVACAVAALDRLASMGWPIRAAQVTAAVERVRWPGRLEHVAGRPTWLFDAAHNPDGCRALASYLVKQTGEHRIVLVFGAMTDKDHGAMLACFDHVVGARVYFAPKTPRAAAPRELARIRKGHVARDARDAMRIARRLAGRKGLVVVAGSIFALAEMRQRVLGVAAEPPIAL